ncbi:MAG: hypothetical protein UV64_C0009G0015 [Parcubacteria group bacterium GW2011_GWC1_43_11b]|uniref:Uncharacterized protein n=2 Tax=Candidatus Vogeliibacteriota TaxID=1817922 RepID=A0A1G2QF95_9BACT|nr:MAG: hypothetical protein UV50_C0008G0010 [Parcubacteria group bacterium GW2011_GWB1_42_9]KKS89212.1 MAG: hypothetical protein UV64_C0009G0015 [Parcubacteria group bacterium GW2011_GWC1_43_11b]KKT09307.1 MAG: hypothetical protein UV88_C0012G0014 [Parcubacteria group bacterium GW2011_GWA1_43_21]OHA59274.1 MAG: hypothetical protein A2370_01860 [Candidatus Vogelbacteria bacterium RIFOXYB1_FULL_42_16]OHA60046.1 MAG: hypothetical protein A2607_00050 [Candidatus Vogelbacteria bacterium RIFOXYD1_FU
MKKTLPHLVVAVGIVIVIQGLLLKQIIPIKPFLLYLGIGSDTMGLFIIPFLIFFIKFTYLLLGSTITLIIEFKDNLGKDFDPSLPSASVLGSPRFNVSEKLMLSFYSFFTNLMSEFFLWVTLISSALIIVGLYVFLGLIENNKQGILPILLNLLTGFSLIILPFATPKKSFITYFLEKFQGWIVKIN